MVDIVGLDGRPLRKADLTEQVATAELMGVRRVFEQGVAGGMTPERLINVLERSIDSDPRDYLVLAEQMEERDAHYRSVVSTRRLAVTSIPVQIDAPNNPTPDEKRVADAVRDLFAMEVVSGIRDEMMDAISKSFSAAEIVWEVSERQYWPKMIAHCPPEWFTFHRDNGRELRLRDESDPVYGLALHPYKWLIHIPKLKAGLPIRNGLARVAAFSWLMKSYALKNWAGFCEVFGMPIRVGKYSVGAQPQDRAVLRRAVANIGSDAAAIIPEHMKIEFIQASNVSGAADIYEGFCRFLDEQMSKCVLGQTNTTDSQSGGLGSGQAEVHERVRGDIRDADGTQEAAMYARCLVRPFVDLNFGKQKRYPKVTILQPEVENLEELRQSLAVYVPMGLGVDQNVIRAKLGIPDPEPGAALLGQATTPALGGVTATAANFRRHTNAQLQALFPDTVGQLTDNLNNRAQDAYKAMLEPVVRMLNNARSMQEALQAIDRMYPDMPDEQLAELLRDASAAAYMAGRAEVKDET